MKHARPTIFWGAPRIWEKLEAKLKEITNQLPKITQKIPSWDKESAPSFGVRNSDDISTDKENPSAKFSKFHTMKSELGLEESKILMVTSAPMKTSTLEFFKSIDLPIMNVYGMTE